MKKMLSIMLLVSCVSVFAMDRNADGDGGGEFPSATCSVSPPLDGGNGNGAGLCHRKLVTECSDGDTSSPRRRELLFERLEKRDAARSHRPNICNIMYGLNRLGITPRVQVVLAGLAGGGVYGGLYLLITYLWRMAG